MQIQNPFSLAFLVIAASLVLTTGCDFGAARDAAESVGVVVELPPIETTVSGQIVDAASGELVEAPVTLHFKGPDKNATVDMYSDPLPSQKVSGGFTSFGIRNGRHPTSNNPVRLRVVAQAEGYQKTSEVIEIHETGTREFVLDMLSTNPTQQPEAASGIRDRSGKVTRKGTIAEPLHVQTPATQQNSTTALYLPQGSALEMSKRAEAGDLTVDLSYYPPTERTLEALPGNGTVETDAEAERFTVAGYMNVRLRAPNGNLVKNVADRHGDSVRTQVRLPDGATHPSTGAPLRAGDTLELFRYDSEAGLWHPDTTVIVKTLGTGAKAKLERPPPPPVEPSGAGQDLGIRWNPWAGTSSEWWAWGTRTQTSCSVGANLRVEANGQSGQLSVTLQRSGLQYSGTASVEELAGQEQPLSQLLSQSSVPQHSDYTLTLTTRDEQSTTIENVNPCSGSYTATLPQPSSVPRTDVLFRGYPECPGDQKVRITSVPTLTIYYRESDAPAGASWHTAGDRKISWVMDDPNDPTYIRWAELRLDGLKQDTRYQMYTTYDGDRYEASARVPVRDTATIKDDRVLVEYSQDFSSVCS